MDHFCYLCLVFVKLLHPFIAALWPLTGKGLTYWLSIVMFNIEFLNSFVLLEHLAMLLTTTLEINC